MRVPFPLRADAEEDAEVDALNDETFGDMGGDVRPRVINAVASAARLQRYRTHASRLCSPCIAVRTTAGR